VKRPTVWVAEQAAMIAVAAAERARLVVQPGQMPAEVLDGDWIERDGVIAAGLLSVRDLRLAVENNPGVRLPRGVAVMVDQIADGAGDF
jgi:hypothetical protein